MRISINTIQLNPKQTQQQQKTPQSFGTHEGVKKKLMQTINKQQNNENSGRSSKPISIQNLTSARCLVRPLSGACQLK